MLLSEIKSRASAKKKKPFRLKQVKRTGSCGRVINTNYLGRNGALLEKIIGYCWDQCRRTSEGALGEVNGANTKCTYQHNDANKQSKRHKPENPINTVKALGCGSISNRLGCDDKSR